MCINCKSWEKFWDGATGTSASFVLGDKVNFSTANFQASVYPGNNLWNDYVKNDGAATPVTLVSSPFTAGNSATGQSTRLSSTGTACATSQTGGYGTCIHAGMMRSFTISGFASCSGLQVEDSLGAFHWLCEKRVSDLRIVSAGFKEGKYLSDLIDFAAVKFKAMAVTVTYQGQSATSAPQIWWQNTVQNLPSQTYGPVSSINLVQSDYSSGTTLTPQADKTALVMKPGVKYSYTSSGAGINNSTRNFSWFEGTLDKGTSTASAIGVALTNGAYVTLQNFSIANSSPTGNSAYQINGKNCYFRDIRFANAAIAAEKSLDFVSTNDDNLLRGVITTNDMKPVTLNSANNIVVTMTNANTNSGAEAFEPQASAISNIFLNTLLANNNSGGTGPIRFNVTGMANNTWMNLAAGSSPSPTIHLGTGTPVNMNSQFINVSAYVNSGTAFNTSASAFSYFSGIVQTSVALCGNAANGGFTAGCAPQDASDFTLFSTGLDSSNSFVGKITVDDPANASDAGAAMTNYAAITDWVRFANAFRGYGLDVAVFPGVGNQGRCSAVNCRIWDWSLRATDLQYRNTLAVPNGNQVAGHKWSAATQPACTQPGAQWIASGTCTRPPYPGNASTCTAAGGTLTTFACLTTFLRNAYEIIDDGIGNENGLCESDEACIYTPNIASYQGHGNLTCIRGPADLGCPTTFTNGTISNVVLYQYATNGY